ncbi:MAG: CRISPR-associated endoribonuclease Cas6 [Candidatus Magnetoovum sp. WYHC-5]|nr:CRISPR-associated endoribonuclease Cas6 [Candidatus Magnetoovum sp. WYHC-5]
MRITFTFDSKKIVVLPIDYNYQIQGFIYGNLDCSVSDFIHNKGFLYEKRVFKLFTFSRLVGKYKIVNESMYMATPCYLTVSSPVEPILQSFSDNVLKKRTVMLGSNTLYVDTVDVYSKPDMLSEVSVYMVSPVTVYSTFKNYEGISKTYYYSPFEKEFTKQIQDNIIKKYIAYYHRDPDYSRFEIEPVNVSKNHEKVVKYKGFVTKAWMGKYRLKGDRELIGLAYDAGIGSKNSQGFGCFELCGNKRFMGD